MPLSLAFRTCNSSEGYMPGLEISTDHAISSSLYIPIDLQTFKHLIAQGVSQAVNTFNPHSICTHLALSLRSWPEQRQWLWPETGDFAQVQKAFLPTHFHSLRVAKHCGLSVWNFQIFARQMALTLATAVAKLCASAVASPPFSTFKEARNDRSSITSVHTTINMLRVHLNFMAIWRKFCPSHATIS